MLAGAAAVLLAAACGVSEDQEVQLGRQNAEQINSQITLVRDPIVTNYVRDLGLSIARTTPRADLDWQFFVVNSREVNAFALPGGFIYVNRGLIERAAAARRAGGSARTRDRARGAPTLGAADGEADRRQPRGRTGLHAHRLCNSDVAQAALQVGGAALFARYSRTDEQRRTRRPC
jgi:hypothetical protein